MTTFLFIKLTLVFWFISGVSLAIGLKEIDNNRSGKICETLALLNMLGFSSCVISYLFW